MAGGQLFPILIVHLLLTALPGAAACLVAARLGVRSVPVLLAIALAASGVLGMLSFWAYYADPVLGESLSYFVLFGSVGLLAWSLYGGRIERSLLRQLATPLVLWALGCTFLVFLGFLHGGESEPIQMASHRFSSQLPSDSGMPYFFATWFFENGHHGTVPTFPAGWLSSDRPPLQVGYVMLQRPLEWGNIELHYQVLGVVLQQLWIVGLWALLVAARLGRVTRALIAITVLLSDLAIVNGFFVWPKLLPAAMLLAAAALVITPLWKQVGRNAWGAVLVALLLGLAMLGHGSSLFGIVPLILIAALRGIPSWRWLGVAALVGLLLMGPWSAYQRYADPPGNRLVKYTLAGVTGVDDRGVLEAVSDAYGEAGVGGTLHNKAENFVTMAGGGPAWGYFDTALSDAGSGDLSGSLTELRTAFFFYLFPAFGLLLIAPVVMAAARRRGRERPREWSFALTCFAILAVGSIIWGLIVFGDFFTRTVIHVDSYLLPILGLAGAIAGLRACFPRFAIYYAGISAALMLAVYVPALEPGPGSSYSVLAALVATASLVGFVVVSLREGTGDVDQTSTPSRAEKPTIAATAATSLTLKTGPTST
jgi:hypothetical protein